MARRSQRGRLCGNFHDLADVGIGSASFTTQSGLAYSAGARARASDSANTANYMEGLGHLYSARRSSSTCDTIAGIGTFASWNINVAGNFGATGATGATGAAGAAGAAGATGAAGA